MDLQNQENTLEIDEINKCKARLREETELDISRSTEAKENKDPSPPELKLIGIRGSQSVLINVFYAYSNVL